MKCHPIATDVGDHRTLGSLLCNNQMQSNQSLHVIAIFVVFVICVISNATQLNFVNTNTHADASCATREHTHTKTIAKFVSAITHDIFVMFIDRVHVHIVPFFSRFE